ncbi:MAG: hypothetical protein Q9227_002507 [Pyrenula ochraceoflavens]
MHNTSLSTSARLFCYLGPPVTVLLTATVSPRTALLSPVAFIPTAWSFKQWQKVIDVQPSRRGKLETMVWTFAATGTIGITSVALVQMAICSGVGRLLFKSSQTRKDFFEEFGRATVEGLTADQLAYRAQLASSWQNWVFNAVLFYIGAGLMEELLKYLLIIYARRQNSPEDKERRDRAYLDYALSSALAFSVVENIGFFYASCEGANESWPRIALTLVERSVLGSAGHVLAAALTALRAIRKDYYGEKLGWWGAIGPSVLYHGTFDFVAMCFSMREGNVGWIHPSSMGTTGVMLSMAVGMVGTLAWRVRRNWKLLQNYDLFALAAKKYSEIDKQSPRATSRS